MAESPEPDTSTLASARKSLEGGMPAGSPLAGGPLEDGPLEGGRPEGTRPAPGHPGFIFFGAVAAVSLACDVASKAWAEVELTRRSLLEPMVLVEQHLSFALAYNRGGAWGLLQNASETVRRPFFLVVSVAAIAFIVSLYGKLQPGQRALSWGLPLVLGGALGNLADRITRGSVVDFIDYRAGWVESMNQLIASVVDGWHVTDHWPTFNVADISICVGVGLMALDMAMSGRRNRPGANHRGAHHAGANQPAAEIEAQLERERTSSSAPHAAR